MRSIDWVWALALVLAGCAPPEWGDDAAAYRGQEGVQIAYDCPPGGVERNTWGTNVYTDDSSVCSAAVHMGLITFEDGGSPVIEILPGRSSYCASTHNGVFSGQWGRWNGSFRFPEAVDHPMPPASSCGSTGGGGGGGSCPAGEYRLYSGGPCEPPTPTSCPNGWVVCNCPATHGLWCHPDCDDYLDGLGGPGTFCNGVACF